MKKWLKTAVAAIVAVCVSTATFPVMAARALDKPLVSVVHEGIRFSEGVYPYDGGIFISNFGSEEMSPQDGEKKGYILYRKEGITKTIVPANGSLHKPTALPCPMMARRSISPTGALPP